MATGKGNNLSNGMLKLVFNATGIANLADNTATSPLTNLFVSLHTANPAATGNQTTSEAAYTSYARVAVARTTGGWTASTTESTSPVAAITFPTATGGSETETYAGIGSLTTGAGVLYYFGQISPSIVVTNGITPQLTTGSSVTEA